MFEFYPGKTRVFITTDIGLEGEHDDLQSLFHLLLYTNAIEIIGISCSHPGGNIPAALKVINSYAKDYKRYNFAALNLQSPESLRKVLVDGAKSAGAWGVTAGSKALVKASLKGKLLLCVWGAATDLAAALQSGLDIENVEAHIIGSWNSEKDQKSARFVASSHLRKTINNTTFRGMYLSAPHTGRHGVRGVVTDVIRKCGACGAFIYEISETINIGKHCFKAGDTGSTLWAISKALPTRLDWSGKFARLDARTFSDSREKGDSIGAYAGAQTLVNRRKFWMNDFVERLETAYRLGKNGKL
jgi:hypothetical protein